MAPSMEEAKFFFESIDGESTVGGSSSSTSRAVKRESSRQTRPLTAEALVFQWQRHAEKVNRRNGYGPLSTLDKQAIALRACKTLRDMDLQSKGHVEIEEWLHSYLLKQSGATATQINSSLREALKRHPRLLEDLQRLFKAADTGQSGRLTLRDLIPMYTRKLWHIQPTSGILSEKELQSSDPEKLARDVMKDMDFDGDNTVSYAEFMAFCLGRRKQEVVLHMYDVSAGLGKSLTPLLGEELQHWWHTGVVVYNREYFWACDTVHDDPGKTAFGAPIKSISLGYTLWRQDELHDFIITELQPIFHRETYDIIRHNCNHFSDRLVKFLVGRRLPDEVLNQDDTLQKLTTIKIVRPLLQLWSRETMNARDGKSQAVTQASATVGSEDALPLVAGSIVKVHPNDSLEGEVTLGIVCNEEQPKRVARKRDTANATMLMCGGCNAVESTTNEVWVRHFEITFNRSVQDSVGQVITDLLPRSRVSLVDLGNVVDENMYRKALMMMNASARQTRPGHGASGGLVGSIPSVLPGAMDADDDLLEDLLDDFPDTAPFSAREGSTLWAVMASPGKTQKELDAVTELTREGFSVEAASASLSSTDWQVSEARALLVSRERLRAVASNRAQSPPGPSNCPLQPRFKSSRSPKQATADTSVEFDSATKRRQDKVMINLDDILENRSDAILSNFKTDRSLLAEKTPLHEFRSFSTDEFAGQSKQVWSESVLNI